MTKKLARQHDDGRLKTNVFSGLIAAALSLLLIGYLVTSLLLGNFLWVLPPQVDVPPERIIVYEAGTRHEIGPDDPAYEPLARAIAEALRSPRGFTETTGLSDVSQQEAYERFVSVEVWYPTPVQLNMRFRTIDPTRILIPISGRHQNMAFLGTHEEYAAGALLLDEARVQAIRAVLRTMGIQVDS